MRRRFRSLERRSKKPKEEVYSNSKIVQVIKTYGELGHEHKFETEIIARRANDSIVLITEPDYKNLNKIDIEDIYLLCINDKVGGYAETGLLWLLYVFIRSTVIWERVHDFQLGMESYQQKVNLTALTITFPGIEKYRMLSIVSVPVYGIIYKNTKKEKRVMRHHEVHKFCDATLERVLEGLKSYNNNVKHGYVTPSLSKEYVEYMKPKEEVYSNSKIVQVIKTYGELGHEHKFETEIIARRANDSIVLITEPDYKNLNKIDIEDIYLLCINDKVGGYAETGLLWLLYVFIRSTVIWERVHDFQLGIEKYRMLSIVSVPVYGIIYKNTKKEKRVMRHHEKKRKRYKLEDEPFVKHGKVIKKGRTITCQSYGNIRYNKATCKGQGGNNAEAIDSASGQAQQSEPVVGQVLIKCLMHMV
nr:hypothetical protein [Tanacetum cinerariifolium]